MQAAIGKSVISRVLFFLGHMIGSTYHLDLQIPKYLKSPMIAAYSVFMFCEAFLMHTSPGWWMANTMCLFVSIAGLWGMWRMMSVKVPESVPFDTSLLQKKQEKAWKMLKELKCIVENQIQRACEEVRDSVLLEQTEYEVLKRYQGHYENKYSELNKEILKLTEIDNSRECCEKYAKLLEDMLDKLNLNLDDTLGKLRKISKFLCLDTTNEDELSNDHLDRLQVKLFERRCLREVKTALLVAQELKSAESTYEKSSKSQEILHESSIFSRLDCQAGEKCHVTSNITGRV